MGEDGVTHHGLLDLVYLRCIPSMSIASPADEATLRGLMTTALSYGSPLAIRYPRGRATTPDWKTPLQPVEPGKGRIVESNPDSQIAILTLGPILSEARKAVEKLKSKDINVDLYDMIWLKPLDEELLKEIAAKYKGIITIEDAAESGGFGSAINEWMLADKADIPVVRLGVPDKWIGHGSIAQLRAICGFDSAGIEKAVEKLLSELR